MLSLRPPGLGPIVGHTTNKSARLWIRAADPDDKDIHLNQQRRTLGVVALVKKNNQKISAQKIRAYYFRLHRKYDRTGVFTLGEDRCLTATPDDQQVAGLQADTVYEARLGSLTLDAPDQFNMDVSNRELTDKLPDPRIWIEDLGRLNASGSSVRFRTFPDSQDKEFRSFAFLLGSCRYPGFLSQKNADRIFKPMVGQVKNPMTKGSGGHQNPAAFTLMVGDQIYADLYNRLPTGRADTAREFQKRYLSAFGTPYMRELLRSAPNYMILDDHEIEDNWHQDRMRSTLKSELFNLAISAYRSYQWVHGPKTFGDRLYYKFDYNGYPFFVLDTRTHRYIDDDPDSLEDNHLLGRPRLDPDDERTQLDHLIGWLMEQDKDIPKFIVSSSVFVPSPLSARWGRDGTSEKKIRWKEESDSWPGFPVTKATILRTMIEEKIQNVIFLSGDIHSSCVSEIRFSGGKGMEKLKAFSVVSSAFHWPYWFADGDPANFVHDSTATKQEDTFPINGPHDIPGSASGPCIDYKSSNFTQENNFCRIEIDGDHCQLLVKPIDDRGKIIRRRGKELIAGLQLAKW